MITTNKAFKEWNEIFPNAACVVTLVDRLVHKSDIVTIKGKSYRLKEAKERAERQALSRVRTGSRRRRPEQAALVPAD
ncbi:MAG: ATP-binding protein [Candidatus Wallbacteria bacterium]|nr:ATP-binding protein [Candidatus Wallbacteria bacterium]